MPWAGRAIRKANRFGHPWRVELHAPECPKCANRPRTDRPNDFTVATDPNTPIVFGPMPTDADIDTLLKPEQGEPIGTVEELNQRNPVRNHGKACWGNLPGCAERTEEPCDHGNATSAPVSTCRATPDCAQRLAPELAAEAWPCKPWTVDQPRAAHSEHYVAGLPDDPERTTGRVCRYCGCPEGTGHNLVCRRRQAEQCVVTQQAAAGSGRQCPEGTRTDGRKGTPNKRSNRRNHRRKASRTDQEA